MIKLHVGTVLVQIPVKLLQRGLADQMLGFMGQGKMGAREQALKQAFKLPARLLLMYAQWKSSTESGWPPIDEAEIKKHVLEYAVTYFSSMILDAVAQVEWVARYDLAESGTQIQITGMAPTPAHSAEHANGADGGTATGTDRADQGEPGGTLAPSGHVG